jgi:hypothetical protein
MDVCLLWVLSGRGLCDGLITRPEESFRLWCFLVCDLGTFRMRRLKLVGCLIEEEEGIRRHHLWNVFGMCPVRIQARTLVLIKIVVVFRRP